MKYCFRCGKQIHESTIFCPYCGARQGQDFSWEKRDRRQEQTANTDPNYNPFEPQKREPTFKGKFHVGWFLLGLAVPIAGLVLFLVWRKREPGKARSVGFGALAGVLLQIILEVLLCTLVPGYFDANYVEPFNNIFEYYGSYMDGLNQSPSGGSVSGADATSYHFLN